MQIYLVGGAVRDKLLGLDIKEKDWLVVGATADELLAQGYQQVGKSFPVFLHPESHEEYALARTEQKTGPGYTGFSTYHAADVSLEDDLQRRDLTINAIAETADGQIIDPYNGQSDLNQRILRHVSSAFTEDPVRLLRVARFMARFAKLGFTIAPETHKLMTQMVQSGEVDNLVAERVWQELEKALSTDNPELFFTVLSDCGALARLIPSLAETDIALNQSALKHACTLTNNSATRFAAWAGALSSGTIEQLGKDLRTPNEHTALAILVSQHHVFFEQSTQLPPPDVLEGLKSLDAYRRPERFESFLLAAEAIACANPEKGHWPHPQREYLHTAFTHSNAISARDLTKVRLEGKALADELDIHRRAVISKVKRTYRWAKFN